MRNKMKKDIAFQVLSDEKCKMIVDTTCKILAEEGIDMNHEGMREKMKEAGCRVEGNHVWIPKEVMDDCLASTPEHIDIYDRDGNYAFTLGDGDVTIGPANTNAWIYDPYTRERRTTVRNDAALAAQICDALPNIGFAAAMSQMTDVNQDISCVYESYEMLQNTSKPICSWTLNADTVEEQIELYIAARGGDKNTLLDKPYVILLGNPESPLVWDYDGTERLIRMVNSGIIPSYGDELTMGTLAPATIAGALVDCLLTCFVADVVAQLTRKGAPIQLGIAMDSTYMKTGGASDFGPERNLLAAAVADLTRYIHVPVSTNGGCTDSPIFDQQAAFDISQQIYTSMMGGVSFIGYTGFLETHMGASYEALVFCDEVYAHAAKFIGGIEVNEDTLAEQAILQAGKEGMFLGVKHTRKHCREFLISDVFVQDFSYEKYIKDGSRDLNDRLNAKVRKILDAGNQKALPEEILAEMKKVMEKVDARSTGVALM